MPRKQKVKVRISLVNGEWWAQAGNNNSATRFALVPAIHFCDRVNQKQRRGKPLEEKLEGRKTVRNIERANR